MGIKELGLNFFLAFLLFLLNGLLGKLQYHFRGNLFDYGRFSFDKASTENFAGNYFQKIVNPTVFLALLCALFQGAGYPSLCRCLWPLIPFYHLLCLLFAAVKNRLSLLPWPAEILSALLSLALGEAVLFTLILPLIRGGKRVFIPLEEFRNAVWFAILAYLGKTLWDIGKSFFTADRLYPPHRRQNSIAKKYDKFVRKYGGDITKQVNALYPEAEGHKEHFLCLFYAVMIYEDYNRPCFFRLLEQALKRICPAREMSLGIMQVKTRIPITDRESISLAVAKLLTAYLAPSQGPSVFSALADYNPGLCYSDQVLGIYETLLGLRGLEAPGLVS